AELLIVFAGTEHSTDDFRAVLNGVRDVGGDATIIGGSTTGIITVTNEIENASAVAVLAVGGGAKIPPPFLVSALREDPREAGEKLGRLARARLGANLEGAALVVLADPHHLDATAFASGIAEGAPGLAVVGAGVSSRDDGGARVFSDGEAMADAAVGFLIPARLRPSIGTSHGCQAVSEPFAITAVENNVILEIDGRPAIEVLKEVLELPDNRPLEKLSVPLLAGLGDRLCDGRSDYVVRPFVVPDESPRSLALPEPLRVGQTIRFTLRDAISARDDMKAMLQEQTEAWKAAAPTFGLFFNCAGRGSALYGQSGLDPELIHRRFGELPMVGIESTFEIAPTCGHPQVHMLTGVLLLAGGDGSRPAVS
ncbi:MAG TPA: FIST N-terminal domain-containing protein, partial [Polyangia bacterium]|nr:FIST N-terminal domain-containing protein [Polyangia bacterium]